MPKPKATDTKPSTENVEQLKEKIAFLEDKRVQLEQLQELVANTSEIVMLISPSGKFLFTNKAFEEALGYTKNEIPNLLWTDLLHERYKDAILKRFEEVNNESFHYDIELVFRSKEQKSIYLSGDISCKRGNESILFYRCLMRDITQRKRAENAQNLYYSIAQLNLSTYDLHGFLEQVHHELQKNIYANNFFVAIYEPEDSSIFFPYEVDEKMEAKHGVRRKMGKGIVEYSIVKNTPLFLREKDLRGLVEANEIYLYSEEYPAIMVLVPLSVNNKTTGVIGIKSYSDANKFSNRDLELLQFVSGQVALALLRKKNEENLLRQTARLNAIFDSSSHVIWTVRHSNKRQLSSFNKNYSDIIERNLGMPPQVNVSTEKMGWRLIHPEDRPVLREKYNHAFKGNPQHFEMHWGSMDGGNDWYEFYLNPILSSENGEIEEVSGMARNITAQKNALIDIQKSEEKFRNTIESFIDIYYRTDLNGNVTMISPSVLTHTGYTLEEVMGNKVDKFFENAIDSSKNIKNLLKSGSLTNFEVKVRHKNGQTKQFMLNIRMIRDAKGIPFEVEGVARDISELTNYATQLKIAKEEAEKSLHIKERFLANMSHEIRTPMNGIIGMIDVLVETPLENEQKEYVSTIKKSSETLLTILNDILDLSKIEAGKMELHPTPLEIAEVIDRLKSLFIQQAKDKRNQLLTQIDTNVPPYILADHTRLLQILSNLTSNALKFTENGTVNVSVKKENENFIRFEIQDSGIGISEEGQKQLFGAFQQLDNSTKKSFGGTGLGLAISKELCKKMNGDMGVTSEEGEGSTFWFTMEAIECEAPKEISKENAEPTIDSYFTTYSPQILLVDDNAINRKVASEILKKAHCHVQTADSGKAAIATFGEYQNFDLILMDIQMPEMDGIETTKKLRERFGKTLPPVIAMTAYSMQNDRERFLEQGMDDYIPKPIRATILLKKVKEVIDNVIIIEKEDSKTEKENTKISFEIPNDIPVIDLEIVTSLTEMVGKEMLETVYADFLIEATEQIDNTEKAFEMNDVKTIQAELHTLKGNAGTIGIMRLYEATKNIEEPSKTGDLTNFSKKLTILKTEFENFKNHKNNYI